MKGRIALAALLGGLTLFVWGALSHMVLQLGDAGMRAAPPAPGDQALLDTLHATLGEDGLYFFPGMDMAKRGDDATMKEWAERTETNPHGIIIYNNAAYGGMGGQLAVEFVTDVGVALLAAILLSWTLGCCAGLACRVGFVTLLGLLTAYRPIQHWNWYEFPCTYTCAQVADGVLGFLLMGIVISLVVKSKPAALAT